jgi:hypothetical protein
LLATNAKSKADTNTPQGRARTYGSSNKWTMTMLLKELINLEGEINDDIRVRRQLGGYGVDAEPILRLFQLHRLVVAHLIEQAERKKK